MLFLVMGVSGAGKSTIGAALAKALGVDFVEGDVLHSPENRARMAAGIPLTDDDRAGWLHSIAARLAEAHHAGTGLVVSCSALKRAYRDLLRAAAPVRFVFLHGDRPLVATRLEGRQGHFMPASLLDSQFATLEPPAPDEDAWSFDVAESAEAIVLAIVGRVLRSEAARQGAPDGARDGAPDGAPDVG